jgi:uncharacterized protein YuzE
MLLSKSVVEDMMVLAQFEIQVAQFWRSLPNCASFDKKMAQFLVIESIVAAHPNGTVVDSNEVRPGVVFDFDIAGRVLGIEMLDVSQRTDNPRELAMELVGV